MTQHNSDNYYTDLAKYRIQTAEEDLRCAYTLFESQCYRIANNRAYYAIFHAITALYALDGRTYKKHKDAIGNFNKFYIHTGIFPKEFSSKIKCAEEIRNVSDYNDFFIASKAETEIQINTATELIKHIKEYVYNKERKCHP